ncbi:hypothetical protein [Methanoculleus sp.]|uniref:hypothetical protein n=1 Tax=Methanoculleus sp. TaxID=90427 RepID=UPI002602B59E|nr:hypothetical protein [Methanoculleus sp.]MDI6866221.1 hypothetical protein [Methanoculleus sp.]
MILEEVVNFTEEHDAADFVGFLKSKGCRARREVRGFANADEVLEGSLDDLIACFEKAAALIEEEAEEKPEEVSEEEASEDALWFRERAERYRRQRDRIVELLEGHKPGDTLYTEDDLKRSQEELFTRAAEKIQAWIDKNKDASMELDETVLFESMIGDHDLLPGKVPPFMLHAMLMANEIVEETPEGYRLVREIPAGQIVAEVSPDKMPDIDTDLLEECGLKIKAVYWIDPVYQVIIDPAVYFACDLDEVLAALEGTTVDIESVATLEENLRVKGFIIATLLDAVMQTPGISVDELSGILKVERDDEDGNSMMFEVAIDRHTTSNIVAELRKQGILAGSDQKVKIAGTPAGRKKKR